VTFGTADILVPGGAAKHFEPAATRLLTG